MTDDGTRLIRVSAELMDQWAARTGDGRAISIDWGDPVATIGDERGLTYDVYEPTFTVSGPSEAERLDEAIAARAPLDAGYIFDLACLVDVSPASAAEALVDPEKLRRFGITHLARLRGMAASFLASPIARAAAAVGVQDPGYETDAG